MRTWALRGQGSKHPAEDFLRAHAAAMASEWTRMPRMVFWPLRRPPGWTVEAETIGKEEE